MARRNCFRNDETSTECARRFRREGRCPFPIVRVPGIGEVGADYSATCLCGKRVRVTVRGLYAHHRPARPVGATEIP